MAARERFGPYLLLKRLGQDPLGETFRAGRVQENSLEQVSLLRVLNGSGVTATDLAEQLPGRAAIQEVLRSPNLAHGIDLGDYQGVPYVAYDYISGRDLASLMSQAHERSHPVPTEHALLIAERVGLGLAMAYGSRLGSTPITHGFLVPHSVMVSNEGEIRLLGFEFSQALRQAAASRRVDEAFRRYLSPETLSGAAPSSADDVYSLGIILLELLTGRPLHDTSPEGLNAAIQRVAAQGLPSIATLVARSVAPASERIDSAVTWHQLVGQLLEDGSMSSTPFHLAFYMHNLFRDEIAQETAEIERERSIDLSKPELSGAASASAATMTIGTPARESSTPARESSAPGRESSSELSTVSLDEAPVSPRPETSGPLPQAQATRARASEQKSGGSSLGLWLGLAAALLLIAGAAVWWFVLRPQSAADPADADLVADAEPADQGPERYAGPPQPLLDENGQPVLDENGQPVFVEPGAAADQPNERQQELLAQIDQIVSQRTEAVESNLRSQYDDEIRRLRKQLEDEQKARAQEEARIAAAEEEARKKREADLEKQRQEQARIAAAEEAARKQKAAEQAAATQPDAGDGEAASSGPASGSAGAATPARSGAATTASSEAASHTRAAERPAATQAEPVRNGHPVEVAGPDVVPPRLKSQVSPQYPYAAKRLRREADVEVRVLVDENGKVIDYRLDKKAGYGFDEAAVQAARQAQFVPPTKAGTRVKMWTTIKISFRND